MAKQATVLRVATKSFVVDVHGEMRFPFSCEARPDRSVWSARAYRVAPLDSPEAQDVIAQIRARIRVMQAKNAATLYGRTGTDVDLIALIRAIGNLSGMTPADLLATLNAPEPEAPHA
jgi:hypothetical protein